MKLDTRMAKEPEAGCIFTDPARHGARYWVKYHNGLFKVVSYFWSLSIILIMKYRNGYLFGDDTNGFGLFVSLIMNQISENYRRMSWCPSTWRHIKNVDSKSAKKIVQQNYKTTHCHRYIMKCWVTSHRPNVILLNQQSEQIRIVYAVLVDVAYAVNK